MSLDAARPPASVEHNGEMFVLCSRGCRAKFLLDASKGHERQNTTSGHDG